MDYRILGPLEVYDGDRAVALGGDKQRALLAILLLHANEVVSADRLIDDLWGERPPPTALKTLQAYVSRLRKMLGDNGEPSSGSPHGVLVTRGHGYLLRIEPGELDVDRFRALIEQGREALAAGEPDQAAKRLRQGLALWRGPPLGDLTLEAFAMPAITQLEELQLAAFEERNEADLALGRQRQLVGELAALVERHPLRERLRGQLMLALYRCGRQAEALAVFQEFRRALSEQLGLDPGPGLRQLEAAILTRDHALELTLDDRAVPEPASDPRASQRTILRPAGVRWRHIGPPLLAVAVVGVVALVVFMQGTTAHEPAIAANSVVAINPARGLIAATVPVAESSSNLAAGAGAVWVSNYNANTVSRISESTRAVVQTIPVGSTPSGIAVGGGAVWVANNYDDTVARIDPSAGRVVQTIAVGNAPSGVALGDGSLWVTNTSDGTLSRIDATSGAVIKTIALGGATDVAAGASGAWVSDTAGRRVLRVDPQTNQVTATVNVGTGASALALGDGSVWVANSLDGTLSRINPHTNTIRAVIPVGDGPDAIAIDARGVWVANEFGGTIAQVDPATNSVTRTFKTDDDPLGIAIAGGLLWVGSQVSTTGHRGGTLTVLVHALYDTLDPATVLPLTWNPLEYLTNDGLTAYKRVGGSDSGEVVPDLAISLPTPTDDGLTYTFQLRRGIRYSNGELVRPEDFRRALERDLKLGPNPALADYFANVVGGAACVHGPARCDLARGVVTDEAANTVTFHLVAPDPEFLARLTLWDAVAIPAGTPNHDIGRHPLPATGPYEVATFTAHEARLVRNPYFREWSRAARPDGYPDQIVIRIGASPSAAVTAVEGGRADYTIDAPPPDRLNEVRTRFASQLHVNPNTITEALTLNTRVAPFNDLRVRRALNYAIDRNKIARLVGQTSQPSCQLIPPYIPGYKAYCPYTLNPTPAGTWQAPDLTAAKRLIAASHTRGTPITIWNLAAYQADFTSTGRYLVSLLRQLGYPARVKDLTTDYTAYERFGDSRNKVQAALNSYFPLYPNASQLIETYFACGSFISDSENNQNQSEFCDPRLDAQIRSALAAEATDSPQATGLWATADRTLTDQAPFVSFVTPSETDFVSKRVGNYQYNLQQGVLVDQLWVH
jgi:YVTN family beta-propeller protein